MNSNPNLNPLANHFRSRNVTSDAKSGFAARSISGNSSNTGQWSNNAPDNAMPITTSPTRPVQAPRLAPPQPANTYNNGAQHGAMNTAPQPQVRPVTAMPPQSQVPAQYPQQTAPQLHTPPRPVSSSPPNALSAHNRTPSPNSTPPSQPSPSPSPQRPTHLTAQPVNNTPPQQQHAPYQQQYAQQQPRAAPVHINAVKPVMSVAPQQPSVQQQQQQQQLPQVPQQPTNQEPVMSVHEQTTQEDLQSIPDDMLMALDDAQTRLNEQHSAVQPHINVPAPMLQQEQHVTPVNHEPVPQQHHSVNSAANDELDRLRREVAQLKHDKSKEEELSRMQNQLQNARADLATARTHLNTTARKDQELKREMELLKEQLAWKDQELREVRMTALEQPAQTAQDTRMLEASDNEHVVYNVNTQSDESEPHSVNDQSTHVLNLRMKVGATNTQSNNGTTTAGGKHSPNNMQQLQIQGTAVKNRSPNSNKNIKSSPAQPSSSTKKATVPTKGHKRSRDEMSRGHEEADEIGEPMNKENEKLKLALYKARLRLHNIKKAILTDGSEEKNQNSANLDQLKAELLDCIQMQMTSQLDALKAEIATLAQVPRVVAEEDEPPMKKRKISEQTAQPSEETEKLIESLRGQIEQMTKQHQSARDEAEKSRQTSESLNHMLTELKHVREQDVQRMNKLHDEKTELVDRVTGLETELVRCRTASESARESDQLREQMQSLQEELAKARDELAALRIRGEVAERQLAVAEQRAGELDQLFQDESAKAARYQDENVKLQQECDKLKVVCKQLYLQIKSNKAGSLNNSGNLATSSEQTGNDGAP